jgi:transcriptional regulator GlxA family with amidase domain
MHWSAADDFRSRFPKVNLQTDQLIKKAFESTRKTINEVMYNVGYSDVKAFREVFRKITGMSPLEYCSRYNREASAPVVSGKW